MGVPFSVRVFVDPIPASLSRAMWRVSRALRRYAPSWVTIVDSPRDANIQFMHLISLDGMDNLFAPSYVAIQYCLTSSNGDHSAWAPVWDRALLTWSYYDFHAPRLHRSPLGIDEAFVQYGAQGDMSRNRRDFGVVTSGYVAGPGAEAIEEVAIAAHRARLRTVHIGPRPVGMAHFPASWTHTHNISDDELAAIYGQSQWVSGLRHVEGFELPCVEGLACGARPILFDRPEARAWYEGVGAAFVPECHGEELVGVLTSVLGSAPAPMKEEERADILARFSWERIIGEVWSEVGKQARLDLEPKSAIEVTHA